MSISTIRPIPARRLALLETIEPVARISGAAHRWQDFTEGRRLQARVEARLADGSYRIAVEGRELQMKLPWRAAVGETMELVLASRESGLKFLLLERTEPHAQPNATLSFASRFLGNLAQARASAADPPLVPVPALSGPPIDGRHIAQSLRRAVAVSGLFYEAHLAQWIAGKRSISDLLEEPQNRWSPPAESEESAAPLAARLGLDAASEADGLPDASHADLPGRERLAAIVQQQLALLETGWFSWRGEIWPGQPMRWDITGEPDPEDRSSPPKRWRTRLTLTLPAIGEVTASIELDSAGVYLSLLAAREQSAALMHADRPAVTARMQAAGLRVAGFEIHHGAQP